MLTAVLVVAAAVTGALVVLDVLRSPARSRQEAIGIRIAVVVGSVLIVFQIIRAVA